MAVTSDPGADQFHPSPGHSRRAWRYLLVAIVACGLAVAGCSSGSAPNPHSAGHAKVALRFQLSTDSGSSGRPLRLTCDPASGNQPRAASACPALLKLKKDPFTPVPKGMSCPMILRSNRKILVTGTWFGVTVHRLVVDGGCDLALFDSLAKILR